MTLREMLEELEWQPRVYDGDVQQECPICGGIEPWADMKSQTGYGHDENCELDALIRRTKGTYGVNPHGTGLPIAD